VTIAEQTKEMKAALRRVVVPFLRSRGFAGSFPHFRRTTDRRVELLWFQFGRLGMGEFTIELGVVLETEADTLGTSLGRQLRSYDAGRRRARLTKDAGMADHWFVHAAETAAFYRGLREGNRDRERAILDQRLTFASSYETDDRYTELALAAEHLLRERLDEAFEQLALPSGG
jgi:uncharacterized protein DUF4304